MPTFQVSTRKGKKYSVVTPKGKTVHFGSSEHEHFKDRTGLGEWTSMDHNDKARRASFRARMRSITNKAGVLSYLNKESGLYYSYRYLW
jgi:hypothetical protein